MVSCNAYFAQLGTYKVGAQQLLDTAKIIGISVANPPTVKNLTPQMPQVSYGQGQVVVTPFQMARVAAAIAASGNLLPGRWVTDDSNTRTQTGQELMPAGTANMLAKDMRGVVTSGTGFRLAAIKPQIAGKTGTAELATAPSHAWFIGFAPYDDAVEANRVCHTGRERTLRRHGGCAHGGRYRGRCAAVTFDPMNLLRRIEKSLDHRLRSIFSGGGDEPGAREGIELYRDALDQIAARADRGQTRRPHIPLQPDHDRTARRRRRT